MVFIFKKCLIIENYYFNTQNTMGLLHEVTVPTESATFGMGCFWAPDSLYGATSGVIRTKVGYAGGAFDNPTYRNL